MLNPEAHAALHAEYTALKDHVVEFPEEITDSIKEVLKFAEVSLGLRESDEIILSSAATNVNLVAAYINKIGKIMRGVGYIFDREAGRYVLDEVARGRVLLLAKIAKAKETINNLSERTVNMIYFVSTLQDEIDIIERTTDIPALNKAEDTLDNMMRIFDYAYDDTEGWVQASKV